MTGPGKGKISVLFVRPSMGDGGADKVTATVLNHLDRNRFSVELALLRAEGEQLANVPDDVTIHELGGRRVRWMVTKLRALIDQIQPDVVFSMSGGTNVPSIIAGRLSSQKPAVIVSERSILAKDKAISRRVLTRLKKWTYSRAKTVTAVCDYVADELASTLHLRRESIVTLPNPTLPSDIGIKKGISSPHPWLTNGELDVVVSAGRLVPLKSFDVLLRAFQRIYAKNDKTRLIILGDGPLRSTLETTATTLGLSQYVHFAGFQKNPFEWFSRSQVFALASQHEGMCNAIIEALACGLPVVATDCPGGNRELIPIESGSLVPVGDSVAMADSIIGLIERAKTDSRALGLASQQASARFSVRSSIILYENTIENALRNKQ